MSIVLFLVKKHFAPTSAKALLKLGPFGVAGAKRLCNFLEAAIRSFKGDNTIMRSRDRGSKLCDVTNQVCEEIMVMTSSAFSSVYTK